MPLPAPRHLRPPSGWTRNGPQAPAYGQAGSAASGPTTTAIDSTSLGGRPCLRLVKHALLIYLGLGRSRTGKYLSRAKHRYIHRRGSPATPNMLWVEP